jgi:hypothetical protein
VKNIQRREKKAAGHSEEESGENDGVAKLSASIARIDLDKYIKWKKDEEDRSEKVGVNVY